MIRNWGYREEFGDNEELYITEGQYMAGNIIGILVAPESVNDMNGNVVNAKTFPFPARYKVISDLFMDEKAAEQEIINAINELQLEGCRAIVSSGGRFGVFHNVIKNNTELISFSTPLLMLPFINSSVPDTGGRIVIINDQPISVNRRVLEAIGVSERIIQRCVFSHKELKSFIDANGEIVDFQKRKAEAFIWDMPEKCGILPESDSTPVYSVLNCISLIKNAVAKKKYKGFI